VQDALYLEGKISFFRVGLEIKREILTAGTVVGKASRIAICSSAPITLKVFVTALAIVDDIVAVLIIAIFCMFGISFKSLIAALVGVGASFLARLGIRKPLVYALSEFCLAGHAQIRGARNRRLHRSGFYYSRRGVYWGL